MRLVALLFIILINSPAYAQDNSAYIKAEKYFYTPEPNRFTDSTALYHYREAVKAETIAPENKVDAFTKSGIILQTYGSFREAIQAYRSGLQFASDEDLADSLSYLPNLYLGMLHFRINNLDTAVMCLNNAEKIYNKYEEPLGYEATLYNTFGAIANEKYDYKTSLNYFRKALENVEADLNNPDAFDFSTNIASALLNLDSLDQGVALVKKLLPYDKNKDVFYTNLGNAYLEKHHPDSAIYFLSQLSGKKTLIQCNKLASAYLMKKEYDRAEKYLELAITLSAQHEPDSVSDYKLGKTYQVYGNLKREQGQVESALSYYQQAIIQMAPGFQDTSVYSNPQSFATSFYGLQLLEALVAKGATFLSLSTVRPAAIDAGLQSFQRAYQLIDFIIKSLDNESARFILADEVFAAYEQGVLAALKAYRITGSQQYATLAFRWAEESKAKNLAISVQESQIKNYSGLPDSLLLQERRFRRQLSRLLIAETQASKPEALNTIQQRIRDLELALSRLKARFLNYPDYYQKKFSYDSLNIALIQQKTLSSNSALLSYYIAGDSLFTFVVSRHDVRVLQAKPVEPVRANIGMLMDEIQAIEPGTHYRGSMAAQPLYAALLQPALRELKAVEELLIIPHQELNRIPFEALEDDNGNYVLQNYTISYQYAATFIKPEKVMESRPEKYLALAPFTAADHRVRQVGFKALPASEKEIRVLPGNTFLQQAATKDRFIDQAGKAALIHLATHSEANNQKPMQSYIAFYPENAQDSSFKLYAHELYSLLLDSTRLVFLSACETGRGKLVNGEGIMSLARAFAFAGCPNLITSRWKAEDRATAYISTQFYHYLDKGYTIATALTKAKRSLLENPEYAQFHYPAYWGHLMLVGTPNRSSSPSVSLTFPIVAIVVAAALLLFLVERRKKLPRFHRRVFRK